MVPADPNYPWPVLAAAITGIVTSAVAYCVWKLGRHKDRREATIDLFKTYYSAEMGDARRKALFLVRGHQNLDWSSNDPYRLAVNQSFIDGYSQVIRFYHLLAVLLEENELHDQMAVKLFSRDYGYWYALLFQPMALRSGWWTGPAILGLRKHFEKSKYSRFASGHSVGAKDRRIELDAKNKADLFKLENT